MQDISINFIGRVKYLHLAATKTWPVFFLLICILLLTNFQIKVAIQKSLEKTRQIEEASSTKIWPVFFLLICILLLTYKLSNESFLDTQSQCSELKFGDFCFE